MTDAAAPPDGAPVALGLLARRCGKELALQVCRSQAGFYIGTLDADGLPCSRESIQYWPTRGKAETALRVGLWTQRLTP